MRVVALAAFAALVGCRGRKPPAALHAREEPPLLQLPADVRPLGETLALDVDPAKERFGGTAELEVALDRARSVIWLHGEGLHVTAASVALDGAAPVGAKYEQVSPVGVAKLTLPRAMGPGRARLRFAWDAPFGKDLVGLYAAESGGQRYAATQLEAVSARRVFPSFDEPSFKIPFRVSATVPAGDVAISNTPIEREEPAANGARRVVFAPTKPLPSYLVALVVGPFDVVPGPTLPPTPLRAQPLATRGVAVRGRGHDLATALDSAGQLLDALEKWFGIAYPFEKLDHVAMPDFAFGAMENAGCIVYAESALLYTPGVTPRGTEQRIAAITAHEMAHQWFGDLVTPRWWTDAWLNESFATWMSRKAVDAKFPKFEEPVRAMGPTDFAMQQDALASARAIRQPLEHIEAVWDQFDAITYQKGAAVLAMFERWMGPEEFRAAIHDYLVTHAYGSGSTGDLLAELSRKAGRDVAAPFRTFLDQPGVPIVTASVECGVHGARLKLAQARYKPTGSSAPGAKWQIPVCAAWMAAGKEHEGCTLLAAEKGTLDLGEICPAWVMPNADAAGYYRFALDAEWMKKLLAAKLHPRELAALSSGIVALAHDGALAEAEALAALSQLARADVPEVVAPAVEELAFARERLVPGDARRRVESAMSRLLGPSFASVGWRPGKDEAPARGALRSLLLDALAFDAHDPQVRAQAAARGRAFAGLGGAGLCPATGEARQRGACDDGKLHPEAVAPDLAEAALGVAVQEGDEKLFAAVEARLFAAQDQSLRGRLLTALSRATKPELAQRVLALGLDPRLRASERLTPYAVQVRDAATRDAAWDALKRDVPKLLDLGLVPRAQQALPSLATAFCDDAHLADLHAYFTALLPRVPGLKRSLDHAEERIRLCIADVAAQAPSAQAFFARRAAAPSAAPDGGASE